MADRRSTCSVSSSGTGSRFSQLDRSESDVSELLERFSLDNRLSHRRSERDIDESETDAADNYSESVISDITTATSDSESSCLLDELDRKSKASTPEKCNSLLRIVIKQLKFDCSAVKLEISTSWARGLARFDCEVCNKQWTSRYAWIEVDLLLQQVTHLYKQRCFDCWNIYRVRPNDMLLFEPRFTCLPKFVHFRHVLRNVIAKYYALLRGESAMNNTRSSSAMSNNKTRRITNNTERRPPPHSTFCCEACEFGRRQCWKRGPQGSVPERVVFQPDIPYDE